MLAGFAEQSPQSRSIRHCTSIVRNHTQLQRRQTVAKPGFHNLWQAFPTHREYPALKDLYTALGGQAERNIHVPGFGPNGNTCASRLSVAFNNGGAPISSTITDAIGAATLTTGDGAIIIYRVSDFRNYLSSAFGTPTLDDTSPYDDRFHGSKGIVSFKVNWAGATGHIALWDGKRYREPTYDDYSTYVSDSNPRTRATLGKFWRVA